jgi:hypothetical protein
MTTSLEQQVRERAFHLWEQDGRPHGRADHHWLMAERDIRTAVAQPEAKTAPARKAASPKPATQARTLRSRKPAAEMRH